jgi:hypothetical protein
MNLVLSTIVPLILRLCFTRAMAQAQTNLRSIDGQDLQWKLSLSRDWDVLGPFPIHAREQQFLSPSFPINCKHYPSASAIPQTNCVKCRSPSISRRFGHPHMRITRLSFGQRLSSQTTEPLKSHFRKLGACEPPSSTTSDLLKLQMGEPARNRGLGCITTPCNPSRNNDTDPT